MRTPPLLRPVCPDDEAAVGAIAYATGFFGASAARYFPARELFGRLWVTPYLRGMPPCGFVAQLGGQTVGYIIGSPSWDTYARALRRTVPRSLWEAWPAPQELVPSLRFLLRSARYALPHADAARYPAHLHLNLLPEARGHHLGEQLLLTYLDELRRRGACGVQLSTTEENVAAVHLYRKAGFTVLSEARTPLWTPWLGRPTRQLVMGRIL